MWHILGWWVAQKRWLDFHYLYNHSIRQSLCQRSKVMNISIISWRFSRSSKFFWVLPHSHQDFLGPQWRMRSVDTKVRALCGLHCAQEIEEIGNCLFGTKELIWAARFMDGITTWLRRVSLHFGVFNTWCFGPFTNWIIFIAHPSSRCWVQVRLI